MIGYTPTPDYYNEVICHKDHKYISKHKGPSGKWIYVYKKNPYEAMNEGMNNLRNSARRGALDTALLANEKNRQFNSFMNRQVGKAALGVLKKNNQFNRYMNKQVSTAGKKVAGEASSAYNSAKNRATTTINNKTQAVRKNATSMYNAGKSTYDSAAKKVNSAASTAKSGYNTAVKNTKDAYSSAKSSYDNAAKSVQKTIRKEKTKAAGRKIIREHERNRRMQEFAESDTAAYIRALKKTREQRKKKKDRQ